MNEQEMRELAAKATELFMAQVWRERGKPLNTPIDAQLLQFEKELALQIYLRLSVLGGDTMTLERTPAPDLGPVWQAVQAVGINPVYIGSHVRYQITADGRAEKAPPRQLSPIPPWSQNQELAQRRFLIGFGGNRWAVVDSKTGALYGIVKWDPDAEVSGVTDRLTPGEWDVRDWEGLSLPFHDTATIADARNPSLASRDGFANRLVYRADGRGGLPAPADPELALGLFGDLLFLRAYGDDIQFRIYDRDGARLGTVGRAADGTWVVLRAEAPLSDFAARGLESRAAAAAQLVEWGGKSQSEN